MSLPQPLNLWTYHTFLAGLWSEWKISCRQCCDYPDYILGTGRQLLNWWRPPVYAWYSPLRQSNTACIQICGVCVYMYGTHWFNIMLTLHVYMFFIWNGWLSFFFALRTKCGAIQSQAWQHILWLFLTMSVSMLWSSPSHRLVQAVETPEEWTVGFLLKNIFQRENQ